MIVIINGSLGVGKTSTAWALVEKFENSVMLDGDYIGAIYPRDYNDLNWTSYLYKTLTHLIQFHQTNGYENFVLNYVFENPASLSRLLNKLKALDKKTKTFYLSCNEAEQRQRIIKRNTSQLDWELKRFLELNEILKKSALHGDIGINIDSSAKTLNEVVEKIWKKLT